MVFKSEVYDGDGEFSRLYSVNDIFVQGNYAYAVSPDDYGLIIMDISNPLDPIKKSETANGGDSIYISGNMAYVAGGYGPNDVRIYDVSDPTNPIQKSRVYDGDGEFSKLYTTNSITVSGNYTYVTSRDDNAVTIMKTDSIADLDSFSVTERGNVGVGSASPSATLDIEGFMRLEKYTNAPESCTAAIDGAIALTSNYRGCVCKNGTGWVSFNDGSTACTW